MLKFNQRANDLYKEQRSAQLLFIEQKCLDSRGISNESFSVVGNARINVNAHKYDTDVIYAKRIIALRELSKNVSGI